MATAAKKPSFATMTTMASRTPRRLIRMVMAFMKNIGQIGITMVNGTSFGGIRIKTEFGRAEDLIGTKTASGIWNGTIWTRTDGPIHQRERSRKSMSP